MPPGGQPTTLDVGRVPVGPAESPVVLATPPTFQLCGHNSVYSGSKVVICYRVFN